MAELIGTNCWGSPKCGGYTPSTTTLPGFQIPAAIEIWGNFFHPSKINIAFIQARNPYSRLKSFYRDKIVNGDLPYLTRPDRFRMKFSFNGELPKGNFLHRAGGGYDEHDMIHTSIGCADGLKRVAVDRSWSFEEFCEELINIPYEDLERHLYPQSLVDDQHGRWLRANAGGNFRRCKISWRKNPITSRDRGRLWMSLDNMLGKEIARGQTISEIYQGKGKDFSVVKLSLIHISEPTRPY